MGALDSGEGRQLAEQHFFRSLVRPLSDVPIKPRTARPKPLVLPKKCTAMVPWVSELCSLARIRCVMARGIASCCPRRGERHIAQSNLAGSWHTVAQWRWGTHVRRSGRRSGSPCAVGGDQPIGTVGPSATPQRDQHLSSTCTGGHRGSVGGRRGIHMRRHCRRRGSPRGRRRGRTVRAGGVSRRRRWRGGVASIRARHP